MLRRIRRGTRANFLLGHFLATYSEHSIRFLIRIALSKRALAPGSTSDFMSLADLILPNP
jgi:hypothetical protein